MKYYIIDDKEYNEMPTWLWPNTSPITESFFIGQGGRIEEREDPPEPTPIYTYSKYKLKLACEARNLWSEVKSYIEQAGKWESFLLIQNLTSENQELQDVLPALITAFGAEIVNAVLSEAEI